ncbi:MAG: DUF2156 domain-containing protein [Lachnospiraceae bacterium]|nr:DUF2156 domain-containing protein [Lachnospiraceae bacterium]
MENNIHYRELKELTADDYELIKKYFSLRQAVTCESIATSTYIWKIYYNTKYYINEYGIVFVYSNKDEVFTFTPICKQEDIKACFLDAKKYFNEVLGQKLKAYAIDEEAIKELADLDDKFDIVEERMYFDYLYDAEGLKNLSGKKYHKKKNHVNGFKKAYEGRYEMREMTFSDKEEILSFLDKWHSMRDIVDEYKRDDYELMGIKYILNNCQMLDIKMFGIYVDGALEAFTLGTYSEGEKTAYIHVEKANPDIRGLYAFINQQFIVNCFPEALYVNREDDMGFEGLRQAKMSYNPIKLVKKYEMYEK